jgi:diguanylate cyclase (GGDEF)-like protein
MWADYVIRKILGFSGERLRDYFDDLELEHVIPKLLQYLHGRARSENVVWISKEEFEKLQLSKSGAKTFEAEPSFYSQMKIQSIHAVTEPELYELLPTHLDEQTMPQLSPRNDKVDALIPIRDVRDHKPLAYILVLGIVKSRAVKTVSQVSRDLSYMAKHVGFSLRHWESQRLSFLDDLTGLYNQKYLGLVLENEIFRSQREEKKFSVLFMDVDYFKSVNDTRGHWVGSRLLIEIGRVLKTTVRKSDYAFRYGGDEYVVVLPQTSSEGAMVAAERLRSVIENTNFIIDGENLKLTLSIGLATYPEHAKTYKDIIKMADEAMYCGKNKSRNIVFVAS